MEELEHFGKGIVYSGGVRALSLQEVEQSGGVVKWYSCPKAG